MWWVASLPTAAGWNRRSLRSLPTQAGYQQEAGYLYLRPTPADTPEKGRTSSISFPKVSHLGDRLMRNIVTNILSAGSSCLSSNLDKSGSSPKLVHWPWPTKIFWRVVFIVLPHYVFIIFPPATLNTSGVSFLLITIPITDSSCYRSHAVICRHCFYMVALKMIF